MIIIEDGTAIGYEDSFSVLTASVYTSTLISVKIEKFNDKLVEIANEAYSNLLQEYMKKIVRIQSVPRKIYYNFKSDLSYVRYFYNSKFKLIPGSKMSL